MGLTSSQSNATAASALPILPIFSRKGQALLPLAIDLESQMAYVSCVYIDKCLYV